jgi:hypothetical protein
MQFIFITRYALVRNLLCLVISRDQVVREMNQGAME